MSTRMRRLLGVLALGLGLALPAAAADKPAGKKTATLKLQIKPADVQIFVDEKPVGSAAKDRVVSLSPGRHIVKLVRKHISHEEQISLKAGDSKTWAFQFGGDDKKEDEVKLDTPGASDEAPAKGEGKSDGSSAPTPVLEEH